MEETKPADQTSSSPNDTFRLEALVTSFQPGDIDTILRVLAIMRENEDNVETDVDGPMRANIMNACTQLLSRPDNEIPTLLRAEFVELRGLTILASSIDYDLYVADYEIALDLVKEVLRDMETGAVLEKHGMGEKFMRTQAEVEKQIARFERRLKSFRVMGNRRMENWGQK